MPKTKTAYTLGPTGTDSEHALLSWLREKKLHYSIALVDEFELAFSLANQNDLILIPVGYQNRRKNTQFLSWVDFHFKYYDKYTVMDYFILPTKPMVLIENMSTNNLQSIIHSSTQQLLTSYFPSFALENITYASSKTKAFEMFLENKYQYTIVSVDQLSNIKHIHFQIHQHFFPTMLWIVYRKE